MNLGRRIGPLPLWGWLIAGGGAAVVVFVMLRKKSSATTTATTAAGATATPDALASGYSGGQGTSMFAGDASTTSLLQQIEQQLMGQQSGGTGVATGTYGSPVYGPSSGGSYVPFTGGFQSIAAAVAAGIPVYYQPSGSGPWVQIPASDIFPGSGYNGVSMWVPQAAQAVGTALQTAAAPVTPPANATPSVITSLPMLQPAQVRA